MINNLTYLFYLLIFDFQIYMEEFNKIVMLFSIEFNFYINKKIFQNIILNYLEQNLLKISMIFITLLLICSRIKLYTKDI